MQNEWRHGNVTHSNLLWRPRHETLCLCLRVDWVCTCSTTYVVSRECDSKVNSTCSKCMLRVSDVTLEDVRGAFYSTDCISATDSGIASEVPLNLFHVVLTLILAQLVSALRAAWTTRVGVCAFTNKPPLVTTLARSFVRGVEQVAGWACRSCQGQSFLSASMISTGTKEKPRVWSWSLPKVIINIVTPVLTERWLFIVSRLGNSLLALTQPLPNRAALCHRMQTDSCHCPSSATPRKENVFASFHNILTRCSYCAHHGVHSFIISKLPQTTTSIDLTHNE